MIVTTSPWILNDFISNSMNCSNDRTTSEDESRLGVIHFPWVHINQKRIELFIVGDAEGSKSERLIRKPRRSHSQDFSDTRFLHDRYDPQVPLISVFGTHFYISGERAAGIYGSHLSQASHYGHVFENPSGVLPSPHIQLITFVSQSDQH